MSGKFEELILKVNSIENQLNEINLVADQFKVKNYFFKRKDFLNYSCLEKDKLKIANIKINKGNKLLFECTIDVFCASEQEVEFVLIINDLMIVKVKKILSAGLNNIFLTQQYISYFNIDADVYVEINPIEGKEVEIQDCLLKIWGLNYDLIEDKFDIVELNNSWVVSLLKDDNLYYKIITKEECNLNIIDLNFYAKVRDYNIIYYKKYDKFLLFRVDVDGNLFLDDINEGSSLLIDENVTCVSSDVSDENILVVYVKNKECKCAIFENVKTFYIQNISYNYIINKCCVFYNKYSDKFFLILKNFNGENIMIESVDDSFCKGENISAKCNIFVETYEVNNEV